MSGFLDTSVVVRYLTGDPPDLADRAARIVDGDIDLQIDGVALVEAAYVLSSVYQVPRHSVVDHLVALVQKRNITLFGLEKQTVVQALLLCRPSGRVSFADAFIWAAARESRGRVVYSFDARFPRYGVEVRRDI